MCEDFAPRNGAERASGERGANCALEKPVWGSLWRGKCVKILLPETEPQGPGLQIRNSRPGVRARKPKSVA